MEALNIQLSPFVEWLVKTGVEGSVLIGLILLVKAVLRERLPIRWHYWLWILLLIRLVTPWAPKTRLSAFNFIPHTLDLTRIELALQAEKRIRPPVESAIGQKEKPSPVTSAIADTNAPRLATPLEPTAQIEAVRKPAPAETVPAKQRKWGETLFLRFCSILPLIWLVGATGLSAFILVRNFKLWRLVKGERPITDSQILELLEDCKMQMGIQTIVGVVVTDKVKGPALFGFVRPRLLLPEGLIEDLGLDELYYVFIHELCHLKRRDVYLGWLISLLQILHWFNPLMWFAFHRMRLDREFACDALAVSTMNAEETPVYGRTILNLLERFSQVSYVPSIAGILEDSSQIERRIKMIAKSKKHSPMQWAAAALIFAALAGVGLTDAYPAPPPFEFGTPINLGPAVNSALDDAFPWGSPDGLSLLFGRSSTTQSTAEIFLAVRATVQDSWDTLMSVGLWGVDSPSIIFKSVKVWPGVTTSDGLELYFSDVRAVGYGNNDLWMMKRESIDADWGPPVNLGPVVNSSADEMAPTVAPDGLELCFSGLQGSAGRVRPGGYGHSDLWVTWRTTRKEQWGQPVNLGAMVNSAFQDARPRFSADGLLLFFDSARPGGYGSNDLYVMRRASLSSPWEPPVNLGPTVNSAVFDECAFMPADGSTLFFDSNRSGGYGGFDIWQAPIFAAPACGDSKHPYPAFDLNKDCRVDFADLAMLLAHWLECTAPECE